MFLNYKLKSDNSYHIYDEEDKYLELKEKTQDNRFIISVLAKEDLFLEEALLITDYKLDTEDRYFLNGYQSWTDSNLLKLNDKERDLKKVPKIITKKFGLNSYGDSYFYNYNKNVLHGFDIFYGVNKHFIINNNVNNAYLIIELLKKEQLIRLRSDIKGALVKKGEEFVIFDYMYFNTWQEGMNTYNKLFNANPKKIFGYTSWYNYYQNINEDIIVRDLKGIDKRFDLFQIDDGYETFVGDWLAVDSNKFPHGLEPIVKEIHNKKIKAGLWLAPLVAETNSKLFKEHQEYFKKDSNGNLITCGANWSGFYALDLENKDVRAYIKECLETYMKMGFDFFKLDFLYATNLGYYEGKTRAMVTKEVYHFLREVLKDKLILGCGANMLSAYQEFDYMRIGPDMSLRFDDLWYMRHLHRERISTKVTIQNTISRSIFNKHLFGNDPDVFLLRDNNNYLSEEQKEALITINALFGSVFMASDNFSEYNLGKNVLLDKALCLFHGAKVLKYHRDQDYFYITYQLDKDVIDLKYSINKGVFM